MFLVIICGTRAVWLEALNTSLCFLGFMAPIQMSWNSHTWRSRNWEGPRPFFLHGESKGTLVNIGKHILYKEASKKTPNNTKNEKTQPKKTQKTPNNKPTTTQTPGKSLSHMACVLERTLPSKVCTVLCSCRSQRASWNQGCVCLSKRSKFQA